MPALKSNKPINALINRNFIIRVLENPAENEVKNTKLTSANKLFLYVNDEILTKKLFDKVLNGKADKYSFLIRKRLKIDFQSK